MCIVFVSLLCVNKPTKPNSLYVWMYSAIKPDSDLMHIELLGITTISVLFQTISLRLFPKTDVQFYIYRAGHQVRRIFLAASVQNTGKKSHNIKFIKTSSKVLCLGDKTVKFVYQKKKKKDKE